MKSMDFLGIPYSDHHGFTIPECWTFDPAPEMKLSNEFQKSLKDTFIFCRVLVDRAHPARPPASAEITNVLENQGFWVKSMGLMVPYVANITGAPFRTMTSYRNFSKLAEALEKSSYPTLELLELFMF